MLAYAALAQAAGAVVAGVLMPAPAGAFAATAGLAAAVFGALFRLPPWWRLIHLALPGAAWAALAAAPDPAWFLAAFVATVLVFGAAAGGAVPLYLSSRADIAALAALVPRNPGVRVLDAGCGTGTVLAGLRERLPHARLEGVELSLLPWLVARARGARGRAHVRWGSLWSADLGAYDVVYAFLSPEPMPRLWEKARREMRPGAMLVSNRFAVPGVAPTLAVPAGAAGRWLYVWRM